MSQIDPNLRGMNNQVTHISVDQPSSQAGPDALALAELIVTTLNLERDPAEIDPNAPLFNEGLGLDSIDMLEISLAVSQTYGVKLRADDSDNNRIFRSLRSLSDHIQQCLA